MTLKTLSRNSALFLPSTLILLSLVPDAADMARLGELASSVGITTANARFIAMPIPVTLHILTVIPYSIPGAFQFAPAFRRRRPWWHRSAGKVLVVFGLVTAMTGLWMAQFYPWPERDGELIHASRRVRFSYGGGDCPGGECYPPPRLHGAWVWMIRRGKSGLSMNQSVSLSNDKLRSQVTFVVGDP